MLVTPSQLLLRVRIGRVNQNLLDLLIVSSDLTLWLGQLGSKVTLHLVAVGLRVAPRAQWRQRHCILPSLQHQLLLTCCRRGNAGRLLLRATLHCGHVPRIVLMAIAASARCSDAARWFMARIFV